MYIPLFLYSCGHILCQHDCSYFPVHNFFYGIGALNTLFLQKYYVAVFKSLESGIAWEIS